MIPKTFTAYLAAFFWMMVLAVSDGRTAESPNADEATKAALLAKDLAAFQAYRSLVTSQSYGVSDDQLEVMIKQFLSGIEGQPPRQAPKPEDFQGPMEKRFEQINETLLRKATQGLDPEGVLGLERRLTDYLDLHDQVRAASRTRYDEYVKKVFPTAVGRVGKRMAVKQAKELKGALTGYIVGGKLIATSIEDAYTKRERGKLVATIQNDVLGTFDASWKQSLLNDAYVDFEQDVQKAVSNGIAQLEERLSVLQPEPKARTLAGIIKELQSRVDVVRDSQVKKATSDTLWGSYADFPLVKSRVHDAANKHFDLVISTLLRQLTNDLRADKKKINDEDKTMIDNAIRGDLSAHHDRASSKNLLKQKVNEMVAEKRNWVLASYQLAVESAHSPFDAAIGPQDSKDINHVLESSESDAKDSWETLKTILTEQYGKLLGDVRNMIADEQSRQHAPALAKKTWRPTETEISLYSSKFELRQLRALNVWRKSPPGDRDVLEESWAVWLAGAVTGMKIGQQAMLEQEKVVNQLQDTMAARMRQDAGKGMEEWIKEYTRVAQEKWGQDGDVVATDYPVLFVATQKKIKGVVQDLLGAIAKQQEIDAKNRKAVAQLQSTANSTAVHQGEGAKRLAAAGIGESAPVVMKDGASVENRQQSSRETASDTRSAQSPSAGKKPDEGRSALADAEGDSQQRTVKESKPGVEEIAEILATQNGIVDQVEPEIAKEVCEALKNGGDFDIDFWTSIYIQRVAAIWGENELSAKAPALLPEVLERIAGKLVRLHIGMYPKLEYLVRERQEKIVEEFFLGLNGKENLAKKIRNAPEISFSVHRNMFIRHATNQWQEDKSVENALLRDRFPRLLPAVEKLISGLVAEAIGDRLQSDKRNSEDDGGSGRGYGDDPYGFRGKVYTIGFWGLFFVMIIMAGCWYWNIRYLRQYYFARKMSEQNQPRQSPLFKNLR